MPSWIDITALVVAAVIILLSFRQGLLRTLLDLAAVVFALYLAHLFYDHLIAAFPLLSAFALAYALIVFNLWLLSFLILRVVISALLKLFNISLLAPLDKTLAALAGAVMVLVMGGLVFRMLLLAPLSAKVNAEIENSYARKWLGPTLDWSYRQAEKLARVKEYQWSGQKPGKDTGKKKPLSKDLTPQEVEKVFSEDAKLKDLDFPKLRLKLNRILEQEQK